MSFTFQPIAAATALDPRLQRLVDRRRRGQPIAASASTAPNEVAVVALVSDVDAWMARPDVLPGFVIGKAAPRRWVVTGRLPVARVEAVRADPNLRSLKAGTPLHPMLAAGVREVGAVDAQGRPVGRSDGVVVGIVDFGCDFAHENFRTGTGSRVLAIWDQTAAADPQAEVPYGRVHRRPAIELALTMPDPYLALGYGPARDTPFARGSHGTHVMDIAAGNGRGSGVAGMAPEADILFVEVSAEDVPWSGEEVVGTTFGDSVQLLEAMRWIFDEAGERPCVINVSLGTNGGPHDGTTPVEQGIDAMVRERPNRAVVIAASNCYDDHVHAMGRVAPGEPFDLGWIVADTPAAQAEVEIWYAGNDRLELELVDPEGVSVARVAPGQQGRLRDTGTGQTVIFLASRLGDPNNGDNVIGAYLERGLAAGTWTLRLHNPGQKPVAFHAWIERNDGGQSSFTGPAVSDDFTLGSISCGRDSVVVGSYDAHKPTTPLSWFSSAGPTRDGREKPEVSAPGHEVLAAHSRTGRGVVRKSGTSMAAPMVTGALAMVLAEARRQGVDLDIDRLRHLVMATGRPAASGSGWDSRYGHGKLSVAAMLQQLSDAPKVAAASGRRQRRRTSSRSA